MKTFSQRYGYKPVREQIQIESMDEALLNNLWTALTMFYWNNFSYNMYVHRTQQDWIDPVENKELYELRNEIWVNYFRYTIDEVPTKWGRFIPIVKHYFLESEWYEVYDLIEFISQKYSDKDTNQNFRKHCNVILKEEMSAYRFVGDQITPIIDSEEIKAVEQAIDEASDPVKEHLNSALEKLSDREKPDYRNSIKESISAVEALVAEVTGSKGTLGQIIDKLKENVDLHKSLIDAFDKLYGFTSDEDGVRHAIKDKPKVDFEDAKWMLVTCTAFVNYVRGKLNQIEKKEDSETSSE